MKVRLSPSQKITVSGSADIYKIMQDVLVRERKIDRSKEHFWIVCLAHNSKLVLIELISFGSSRATVVEPTEVFSFALQKKAAQLIMVHNHPHGSTQASTADRQLTEKMAAIGKFVKVPVIDHLIITDTEYFSFADSGLLQDIKENSRYDLSFAQIDRLEKQMRIHEEWAKKKLEQKDERLRKEIESRKKEIERSKKKDVRIVLALKKRKLSLVEIAAITGLPKEQITKINKTSGGR